MPASTAETEARGASLVTTSAPARADAEQPTTLTGAIHQLGAAAVQRKLARRWLQRKAQAGAPGEEEQVHAAAAQGVSDGGGELPFKEQIQRSFGHGHDLAPVQAHVGGAATKASQLLGAEAYAVGERVAFAGAPSLHTAAHEAAHVVQQRAGVSLKGGVGEVGDAYEQNADAVADRVVRGESASDLLPGGGQRAHAAVQKREAAESARGAQRSAAELLDEAIQVVETALAVATGEASAEKPAAPAAAVGQDAGAADTGKGAARSPHAEAQGPLQTALQGLLALRGAGDPEIRAAVRPILAHVGAPGLGGDSAEAAQPVQRNTLVLGAPLLAAGPPGWVAYAVLGVATVGIMGYAGYQTYQARVRERERAEPRAVPRTRDEPQQHRGRIQVQGGGLELSVPWARSTPMTKAEGLVALAGLKAQLSRRELAERDEAFEGAATFIAATLHTCPPDISRTFQNRSVRQRGGEERVDVEIRTGIAFA